MNFIRHFLDVSRFMHLPADQRKLAFYSEGKKDWPHIEGLIRKLLETSNIPICYFSSSTDDLGLSIKHRNYHTFIIGEGFVRNWLFENLEIDVMVMTMPDLHQFQVKRSKYKVHYVYVQHSLVSLHMIYRKGAFDYFDTIFCAGPHHVREIQAMEKKYNLAPKILVEHGYGRLDSIIDEAKNSYKNQEESGAIQHVLIAPSWGNDGIIESGVGKIIIEQLLNDGNRVTLRPHPQTIKSSKSKIEDILHTFSKNKLFVYEYNVVDQESLHLSDIMISDWSGVALEYAFGLGKPVVFIDMPKKMNNPDYQEIEIEPFEINVRATIGQIIDVSDIQNISTRLGSTKPKISLNTVFNVGKSADKGCLVIREICNEKRVSF